jgi:hypothetical protein
VGNADGRFAYGLPPVGFSEIVNIVRRYLVSLGLLLSVVLFTAPSRAQDEDKDALFMKALLRQAEEEYRKFFKRPEKMHELWAAIRYERQLGQFELCALFLKDILAKPPEEFDPAMVKIEAAEGMYEILKIQTIPKWSGNEKFNAEALKNASDFVTRVYEAVDKDLADPAKFKKFIPRLNAPTLEERAFAFMQIKRTKERAAPYLVHELRLNSEKPLYGKIAEAMLRLDSEIVPPLLEILRATDEDPNAGDVPPKVKAQKDWAARLRDAGDIETRLTILDIVKRRADRRAIPYLYMLTASPVYPEIVRDSAKEVLAYFLQTNTDILPTAKVALTDLAEKFYRHKMTFPDAKGVRYWKWDGEKLPTSPQILTPAQAEEFFGLRHARDALELDPTYLPAQVVYLSLLLERRIEPKLTSFVLEPLPTPLQNLLSTVDAELLLKVLERALDENNVPVILPLVQTLGDRAEVRALRQASGNRPSGLTRALYYPDRRVQYTAARAMLRMPGKPAAAGTVRVIEVLGNMLTLDEPGKALMLGFPADRTAEFRAAIEATGLKPVSAKSLRAAFEAMRGLSNFEAVFLHEAITPLELPYVLTQIRADADTGRLPVFLFVPKDQIPEWERRVQRFQHVKVLPDIWIGLPDELKAAVLEGRMKAGLRDLTPEERKSITKTAVDIVWRMAREEIPGYDVRPTYESVVRLATQPDYAVEAIEILGRLPGFPVQQRLTALTLDEKLVKLRVTAAKELARHVQKHGLLIYSDQLSQLRTAYLDVAGDPLLKRELALVLGAQRISPQQTGTRLFQFRANPEPAAPEKKAP